MIRDAARLLNAKLAIDPLLMRVTEAQNRDDLVAAVWTSFDDEIGTVDRAVDSLLHDRISEHNLRAAAHIAEKLRGILQNLATSGRLDEQPADPLSPREPR